MLFLTVCAMAFFVSTMSVLIIACAIAIGGYYYRAIDQTELLLYPIIIGIFLEAILAFLQAGNIPFTLFQVILIFSFVIFVIKKLIKKDLSVHVNYYTLPVLLFLSIIAFSLIYSADRETGVFNLFRFTVLIVFVNFITNFIESKSTILKGFVLATVICLLLAVYSVFESILNPEIAINNLTSGGLVKGRSAAGGIYTDPNRFAASLFLPLAFGFSLVNSRINYKYRLGGLIIFFVILGGIISTYSRSGFLGVALICLLNIVYFNRVKPLVLVGALVIGTVLVIPDLRLALFSYTDRIFGLLTGGVDTSSSVRLMLGGAAIQMFFDSYLFGVGFDAFNEEFTRYYTTQQTITVTEPHNITYEILAELGLHGFLVFGTLIWFLMKDGFNNIRDSFHVEDKIIAVTLFSSFCAYLLFYQLYGGALYDTVWLLCIGLMLSHKKILNMDTDN